MQPYWITFIDPKISDLPAGVPAGIGVTAKTENDAISIAWRAVFKSGIMPGKLSITKIHSIPDLDQEHVVPNMGNMFMEGVWYPNYGGGS